MRRIADDIREVAGYSVESVLQYCRETGKRYIMLIPEDYIPDMLKPKRYRLAVYEADFMLDGEPVTDYLYTNCVYFASPSGVKKVKVEDADAKDI